MATLTIPRGLRAPVIPVDMYRDGRFVRSFESISEAARALRVSYSTIKYILASGAELYSDPGVTLDIPLGCRYSYELAFDEEEGRYIPMLVEDRNAESAERRSHANGKERL